uniref:Oxidoreductase FAD/NAD(P)-binding subunit n=1 Tax=uncultured microorganism TaxID=358574 RepID=F8UHK3_9ZZZZ|nr:oxidoreductase FAD/NAD(P)-binding subunit [uncultured microorganism]
MTYKITIKPSNHELVAEGGETLLEAALREGYALPYGCRNGACGSCKGKVLEGRVDHGSYHEHALSAADKSAGLTLFCCAKPLSDVTIEAREIAAAKDIAVKMMPCRVEKIEKPAPDVAILTLKLPASERLQFLAGQYVEILLKDGKRRAFSLANAPHDDAFLQLHIRHVPGGEFTGYVFGEMQEKTILRFQGSFGTFFLREDSDKPIVLVASGTGFAPIKSILEHAFHNRHQRTMTLYWGARTPRDLYLADLPRQWAHQHANFTYVPVVSEPPPGDSWQGRTGFVHQAVLDDFADLSGFQVYACGAPPMVAAARESFTGLRGLPQGEFFSDAFSFAGNGK